MSGVRPNSEEFSYRSMGAGHADFRMIILIRLRIGIERPLHSIRGMYGGNVDVIRPGFNSEASRS